MIGRTLRRYEILERIGAGAMGVVYRARDRRLERDVALKVLPAGLLEDVRARDRFRREALLLARLNHPNIATVYDFDSAEGVDFLVLELIAGESLDERLARGGLPIEEVVALGVQLARGLEAAHQPTAPGARPLIHRDLKPANLRVTPDGRLKILDFGLARLLQPGGDHPSLEQLTRTDELVGTLAYMAPEQLMGAAPDARTDLYAAGAVLYEMATGERPFADQGADLMYSRMHGTPTPPGTLRPGLPAALDAILLKALERDPALRYAAARELGDDLESMRAPVTASAPAARTPATSAATATRPRGAGRGLRAAVLALAPVVALAIAVAFLPGDCRQRLMGATAGRIASLAVMPLENLSRDADQEYFADGMTDELINDLARLASLKVIARGSVMRYKGTREGLAQIAHELGVDAIVEGTVMRAGDRVRIRTELARARDSKSLWADSYERDLRDVLSIQADVAKAIVKEIQVRLQPGEEQRLVAARAVQPEAYQAYLQGRSAWNKYTEDGFHQAQAYFQHAIDVDPAYAPAWTGLADAAYGLSSIYVEPNLAMPKARAAAEKAIALDSTLADAHASLGIVRLVYDHDWGTALKEFDRAIALQPGNANAHLWRGHLLVIQGHPDEGLDELRKALELDPLSQWINANIGWHLYFARRYDEAAKHLGEAAKLDPTYHIYDVFLGVVREQQGDHAGAVAALEKAVAIDDNNDDLAQLAHAYGTAGRRADAERTIARLLERRKTRFVPAGDLAYAYAGAGDRETALHWLEAAVLDHSEFAIMFKVDPGFDPLRSDPRFRAVLGRIGLGG